MDFAFFGSEVGVVVDGRGGGGGADAGAGAVDEGGIISIIITVEPKKKKEKNVTSNRQVTICLGKQDLYWGSQPTIQFAPV